MNRFEIIARWAHGTYSVVIAAATADQALRQAKPALRRLVPSGYPILRFTVINDQ